MTKKEKSYYESTNLLQDNRCFSLTKAITVLKQTYTYYENSPYHGL